MDTYGIKQTIPEQLKLLEINIDNKRNSEHEF